jgi:subtilisin family serine protease
MCEGGQPEFQCGDVARAIDVLVEEHAVDLLNLSLGGDEFDSDEHDALLTVLDAGVLPLAAAGNSGQLEYPALYEGVVSVGALGKLREGSEHARGGFLAIEQDLSGDDQHELYIPDFSLYELEVDGFAPGVEIISTVPSSGTDPGPLAAMSGSSMAVAIVTGALARALADDDTYRDRPRNRERAEHARSVLRNLFMTQRVAGGLPRALLLP